MRNNANKSGDTPQKWLAKVVMSSAYLFLIALLCVACSREQEEVYQDPADQNVTVGSNASERIESADQHDGRYSVRSYDFNGKALTHKISDVKKTYD